ncbi:MAG TPA: PP2C family protein-serine/threonine phosphatase [Vicinamibacterales bacterium]|nr:PP2C family protein-serine/threonine phosphatase [Vicinamibacterales bacterium]HOQ59043.1 PP2C family protein-serine/threonine phosphatase [Vicinamibacterales bacterium]HPK70321.1 PP2C family protein-serine/threonine phosphatase [Vicinamibacterales bacterium]HPW21558.1 PP2C family protein-serine/threonine phosphatase [Vicinamibacterales bacterium]
MDEPDARLEEELRRGAQYLAQRLTPTAGAIPRLPGIGIHGVSLPLNGIAGGDLLTYVDFRARYDLDARIARALAAGQERLAWVLQKLKHVGGILVADVAGHDFTDAARAAMLHQAFHTGALYEMDLTGQITLRLFEQINTRFCKSTTLRSLAADPDEASYITLIYGEISSTGRFSFLSAGHPPPLVFSREFDRFVEVSQDRLVSYPPIGLQPAAHHVDARRYERPLGYKKRYTVNNLNLMGQGDVLLLYTDGLIEPDSAYTQAHLEQAVSRAKDGSAQAICEAIISDRQAATPQTDDLTLVVIKYR